jgi:hypothetical protein
MKKLGLPFIIIIFIIALSLSFFTYVSAVNEPDVYTQAAQAAPNAPDFIITAADESLNSVKTSVASNPSYWGFDSGVDKALFSLGDGMKINIIDVEKTKNGLINSLTSDREESWFFTINYNGEPAMYMTVGYLEGKYTMLQFTGKGVTNPAKAIEDAKAACEANLQTTKDKDGIVSKLVLIKYGWSAYYFAAVINGEEKIAPTFDLDKEALKNTKYAQDGLWFDGDVFLKLVDEKVAEAAASDELMFGGGVINVSDLDVAQGAVREYTVNQNNWYIWASGALVCVVLALSGLHFYKKKHRLSQPVS